MQVFPLQRSGNCGRARIAPFQTADDIGLFRHIHKSFFFCDSFAVPVEFVGFLQEFLKAAGFRLQQAGGRRYCIGHCVSGLLNMIEKTIEEDEENNGGTIEKLLVFFERERAFIRLPNKSQLLIIPHCINQLSKPLTFFFNLFCIYPNNSM